ncbi:hypothetical protein GEV33_014239 [Tenebrio molitor]|uniref:Uncharacterized protein n=1 Tax=Tenebrio molitor TaxID=7067 RepID=A0A8J6GYN9_TENMO|nr:hypothetical protein GEV33_014239 [Tenebrio molitor]
MAERRDVAADRCALTTNFDHISYLEQESRRKVRADSATFFHHNGNKCAWRRIHAASSGNHAASAGNGANYVSGASPGTARKGRLYPAYSLSGSEGEESPRRYGSQHTYQHPLYQQPAGLSDTPTSENASDATLTDSELALARDSTLLVHNGE